MMFVLPACGSKGGMNGTTNPSAQLLSITLASNSISAGATVQGTVSLTSAAGASGATVTLSSSNTSVATVPGSVNVAAGAQTAGFTVTGQSAGQVTISGSLGTSQSANLTVTAVTVTLVSVSLSTGTVQGPSSVTGTVTLSGPAPSGGTTVGLSSSNGGAATVPSSITVAQGSSTGTFTVNALTVGSNANVTITATLGGGSQTANLSVTATAVPIAANFVVIPNPNTTNGQQCEVQSVPALSGTGSENLMKCTFDASSSTPQGSITSYIWRFPQTGGIRTISTSNPRLSDQRLNCGSFGATGATATRNVTLEIATPAGNATRSDVPVTFVRNGPC